MRLFIFVLLKIVEISAVVFVPYWLGMAWERNWPCDPVCDSIIMLWGQGVALSIMLILGGLLCFLFGCVNWHFSGKLKTLLKGETK